MSRYLKLNCKDLFKGLTGRAYGMLGMFLLNVWACISAAPPLPAAEPLQVMLVPSDGGTAQGTMADFRPLFDAVTAATGVDFTIQVGQSYSAVIEAIATGRTDLAYMGTVSFLTATDRGPVQLVAVSEMNGESFYYSGLFTLAESSIESVEDVRGRTLVLSDPSSSSGFVYPLALLKKRGLEPITDCARIILSGSHTNSLTTLAEGHADVAAAPFASYLKAVRQGVVDPRRIRILAKSDPIPNPPIAISSRVEASVIAKLREAFHTVHTLPGIEPEMIRGHGGRIVDRYNAEVPQAFFKAARENMQMIDNQYRAEVLRRASER